MKVFLIVQKAIIFLCDSKIACFIVTKPNLITRLNCELKLSFPSQCIILEVANTSTANELQSFLHSGGSN